MDFQMKKRNLFLHVLFATMLITQPALIMAMEPLENTEADAVQVKESCTICLDEGPSTDFRQLGCGHRFCVECLKDALRLGLDEEWAQAMAERLRCPKRGCKYQMNAQDVEVISGDEARVARYHELLTLLFINANRNFRRCPMLNCEAIYEVGPNAQTITCRGNCQARFCSHCREPHRQNEPCQEASAPNQNNNNAAISGSQIQQEQEQQYREWLRQNTKPCPQCRLNIQKNGGCNHMTCKSCRHEFCWQCLAHWKNPGQNGYNEFAQTHQGFYTCNAGGIQQEAPAAHGPRLHQNVIELFNDEHRNPLPLLGGYFRHNHNAREQQARPQPVFIDEIDLEQDRNPALTAFLDDMHHADHGNNNAHAVQNNNLNIPREPFPLLGAYFRQNRNDNFAINQLGEYHLEEPLPNRFAPTLERILHRTNNVNILVNNFNIDGAESPPLPPFHPIEPIIDNGVPPAARSLNDNAFRDSHVNDAWNTLPHVFIDGEDYSARMNQFHAEEAAQRDQDRE
jgi:hypothetical protein